MPLLLPIETAGPLDQVEVTIGGRCREAIVLEAKVKGAEVEEDGDAPLLDTRGLSIEYVLFVRGWGHFHAPVGSRRLIIIKRNQPHKLVDWAQELDTQK